mgnify:FL=1
MVGFSAVLLNIAAFGIGILALWLICKLLKLSLKIIWKLVVNALLGALILIVFNLIGGIFGLTIEITFLSALVAGVFGVPGVIVMALLSLL